MTENNNLEDIQEQNNGSSPTTRPQPFIHEPLYKELLQHYQNADWENCARLISQLLNKYPGDESLLEFQREVSVRHTLQNNDNETEKIVQRERRRQNTIKGIIAAAVIGLIIFLATWSINTYRNQLNQAKAEREREARLLQMDAIYENAENYLQAGKWQAALDLYQELNDTYPELLKDNPDFEDLPLRIEEAETMVAIDEKYQQGVSLFNDGDNEGALAILYDVQKEFPQYKNSVLLINRIENTIEIAQLFEDAKSAFAVEDYARVVENYDTIMSIDSGTDASEIDEELFFSYMNLIIQTADRPDATIEDIEIAESYYYAALAIFPQSAEHAQERDELDKITRNLLANKYYIFALELIEADNFSINSFEEALKILVKANNLGPSPAIANEISNISLFVSAVDDMNNKRWEEAINELNSLLRADENYADGFVNYMLYEANIIRGDIFYTYGENTYANDSYNSAAIIAYGDNGNTLMLFETLVKSAYALERLDSLPEAANYLHSACTAVNFADKVSGDPEILAKYNQAEYAFQTRSYYDAVNFYKEALEGTTLIYEIKTIQVQRNDSLLHIAFEYGSTISSIIELNQLGDSLVVRTDGELLIPVLIEDQE